MTGSRHIGCVADDVVRDAGIAAIERLVKSALATTGHEADEAMRQARMIRERMLADGLWPESFRVLIEEPERRAA